MYIKTFSMFAMMVISGVAGAFLYYAFLHDLAFGDVKLDRYSGWRCVGGGALVLSTTATFAVNVFVTETSMILIFFLLPIFMLALQPGFNIAKQVHERRNLDSAGSAMKSKESTDET